MGAASELPLRNVSPDTGLRETPDFNENEFDVKVREARLWHLLVMEDAPSANLTAGDRIYGQFSPQEFTGNYGANVPEAGGFSRTHPLINWVGGNVETFTFQARLWSEHSKDQTARDKFEELKKFKQSLPPMNRPPLVHFFWGNAFPGGIPCFIESLGGVKFDEIRPDGTIRGLSLNISLKRYTPPRIVRNVESPTEQTPVHTVKNGETYEMIAYRRWGDPMLGVVLRRMNPRFPMERWAPRGFADLNTNEQIKLYDRGELTKERIKPASHIFDEDDQISADIRRYYFEKRGRKTAILPRR